jgi:miniconductance mechanosensitive channel
MLWDFCKGLFVKVGITGVWSEVGAITTGLIVIALIDVLFCMFIGLVIRKFIVLKSDRLPQQEKAKSFISVLLKFVFVFVLYQLVPECFVKLPNIVKVSSTVLAIFSIVFGSASISSAITWLQSVARERTGDKTFSSKTFAQVAKIVVWCTALIVIISILIGKSPAFVLSGLGALTAVLMLIFRDPILGLVAGIQAGQNDMVRVGDWITMPKYNADGNVIDIALTTIKVRNFDNTVTMIPSSCLLSDAFVNWRYMSTSKGRRIKRPVWISATTITELSEDQRKMLVSQGLLQEGDHPISNLAAFETWLRRDLAQDDNISKELTCMVRQTEAGDTGIPVEVYCFTKTRDWEEYEEIQTNLFDRILVTLPKFSLQVYQRTGDKIIKE